MKNFLFALLLPIAAVPAWSQANQADSQADAFQKAFKSLNVKPSDASGPQPKAGEGCSKDKPNTHAQTNKPQTPEIGCQKHATNSK